MMNNTRKTLLRTACALLVLAIAISLSSCSNIGYYARCTKGHLDILAKRQPIDDLLCAEDTPAELKSSLRTITEIRDFATKELGLPENGSYRSYVDLQRPYVVWNVVAAPEFELQPVRWCFPVAGCVNYRGFFSREEASEFADDLRSGGYDVYLYGVSAYSTLGWFDDPVLNTFIRRSEADLAGLIFHELAHQKLYIKDDSVFNESFAKSVELEGVMRWLTHRGQEKLTADYLQGKSRDEDFVHLVGDVQKELRTLYARPITEGDKREEKKKIYNALRARYEELRAEWGGYPGYDRWFSEDLNNAKLASIATYRTHVPAFRALLKREGDDFAGFYREAAKIGTMPSEDRIAYMESLLRAPSEEELLADREASSPDSGLGEASPGEPLSDPEG